VATKRRKNDSWEFVVKRSKILEKPIYLTFQDETEGDAYCAKLEALLDRGVVPPEFQKKNEAYKTLAELIKDYLVKVSLNESDRGLLNVIYARKGQTKIAAVNYAWVEGWIQEMKVELNLAPGTIRHHVGALGRCFDWASRRHVVPLVVNPIRQLPKTYAQYTDHDIEFAAAFRPGHERRFDEERDRRLEPSEEVSIRAVLDKEKRPEKERPFLLRHQAALELMFDIALETAMRMREIFTLTLDQVDLAQRTIFLDRTKNGNKRQVPLSTVAVRRIKEYQDIVDAGERGMAGFNFDGQRLFPWWSGEQNSKELRSLSTRLSTQFTRIFEEAGCKGLTFHDLRHEATSRFFERTKLQDFEIMKITGHSSTRMLRRYSNLRASNLAQKLW